MVDSARGVLYPQRLPQFHRLPAGAASDLVAWFWIPEWSLPGGAVSRQDIVAYPALNLVVERDAVTLSGATTRISHRELRGTGWAVGAMLRPAAVAALTPAPAALVDREIVLDEPRLRDEVADAMAAGDRVRAAARFADWLIDRVGRVDEAARQANALVDVLLGAGAASTPDEAATRLAVSTRTLQRMAHRYVGVSPAAMIRRRRLQEAAEALREDARIDLAALAADLGYADHAHLTRDFRAVLGFTPSSYRTSQP
ncbi:helix-turn-helix domain-containing protein [Microbacterium sp.]|uniref:AraC family transcriptional regulator n=1 Tax=Microbacterium sp. TaxID=51671 RepID=UPI0039E22C32